MTEISDELIAAYFSTDYRILFSELEIVLRIGRHSPQLARLHADCGVRCSAFLTAYNPYSKPSSQEVNSAAQRMLLAELDARDLKWIEGAGVNPEQDAWPPEPSVLILGIAKQDADNLARRFRQNAFLFCDTDAIPQLALTR